MCNILTDYNDRNNTPLSNAKIQEAMRKFMEEESVADSNNVTADTFIHASNTHRGNANKLFTSKNLDKSDELVYAVNNFTINNAKYYESNTATEIDAKEYLTRNL